MKHVLRSLPAVLFGNALYALTVALFLLPSGLITGGTTGISLALNHYFGVSISGFVLVFNVCMLLLGLALLGRSFALTTVVSTFAYPLFLEMFERLLDSIVLTDDLLLCTAFSGLGIGLSLGIVIRAGASTGGMDIPPLVLNKLVRIPVSVSMYAFDFAILLVQAAFQPMRVLLYGILLVLIYTVTLDKMLLLGSTRTEVKVVSLKAQEIRTAILKELDRGVTMLDGEGGYSRKRTGLLLSVVSNRELPRLERLIHEIDPESFVVVSRVNEVTGHGFSLEKRYLHEKED